MNYQMIGLGECIKNSKEQKKRDQAEIKDLKATINYLYKIVSFNSNTSTQMIGELIIKLIRLNGPLK